MVDLKKEVKAMADKLWGVQEKCLFFGIRSDIYSAWVTFNSLYSEIFNFLYLDGVSIDDDDYDEEAGGEDEPR